MTSERNPTDQPDPTEPAGADDPTAEEEGEAAVERPWDVKSDD